MCNLLLEKMENNKKKKSLKAIIVTLVASILGFGVALAGSYSSSNFVGNIPLFAFAVLLAFGINWLFFIPSFIFQTEKFFDLTGSLSYISVIIISVILSSTKDVRSLTILVLVLIWAIRLGSFLFIRIMKAGKDSRFDELKVNFFSYLSVWTLQGLWITFTLATALVVTTSSNKISFDIFAIIGIIVWLIGFAFEAISDFQKSKWRAKPENKGKFINVGLWSKSRHPNYFGEITIWLGIAIMAFPVLKGWQFVSLISPLFVTFLLTKVSGIPILEKRSDEKWGGQADYEEYKKNTPVLIPKL